MEAIDFHKRQKELCLLSSFISDHEQWLNSILDKLKWSKESLQCGGDLVKCPYNQHHYVPPATLEAHKTKCFYQTKGVCMSDNEENGPLVINRDTVYQDNFVPSIDIAPCVERAVAVCAKDPDLYREKAPTTSTVQPSTENVEDNEGSGLDPSLLQPQQIISFIKCWKKVPLDWVSISPSSLNHGQLKGWLFQNLPKDHAHSNTVGGEIMAVNSIMHCLTQPGRPSVSPNKAMAELKPLLRAATGPFVLSLWKQLHISHTQSLHGISDSVLETIAPMPLSQLLTLRRGAAEREKEEVPVIYEKIKMLSQGDKTAPAAEDSLPLPMDAVFYTCTPIERRVMYDYVVEAGQAKKPKEKKKIDPDLYRDDEAALKAKLKALARQQQAGGGPEESKSHAEQLKELKERRDYKRRRQKYRAKNVHITRRKTSEVFRDIINNRMTEIMGSLGPEEGSTTEDTNIGHTQKDNVEATEPREPFRGPERHRTRHEDRHRERSKRKRRSRSRSRDHGRSKRSRSRSRERHLSHKKHKKHKSEKHSTRDRHDRSE